MDNKEDSPPEIRLNSLNKIISEWKNYKDFIVDLSTVNRADEFIFQRLYSNVVEMSN